LPQGCSFTEPMGGFSIWLTLPEGMLSVPLLGLARRADVNFTPANMMMPQRNDSNGLRLSFSRVSPEDIKEGITALCSVIRDCIDNPALLEGSTRDFEDLYR